MEANELRKRFLDFFSQRGHAVVPSSSLIPDDPSVLLTTAGMQQFKKYFTGEVDPMKDFGSKNTTSIQKSFRTSDIDEVGDESHLTFFEMLGNFSFGGYGKKEAIKLAWEFLDEIFRNNSTLPPLFVTIFGGDGKVPADEESYQIWRDEIGVPEDLIERRGREDNFWGPTGNEGPCGPTTEIFINGVEVWNLVFNEFFFPGTREEFLSGKSDGKLTKLKTFGVDTGMGLERLAMVAQGKKNIFETDLFAPFITLLPAELEERKKRIIVDHLRGAAFLLADGVRPSNKEAGYILRRLLRRILAYEYIHELSPQLFESILLALLDTYGVFYPELARGKNNILNGYWGEWERFHAALVRGLKELERCEEIDASVAFRLYESFGLPYEVIKDQGRDRAFALTREAFDEEFKKHQAQSKIGQEKKFGGHGLILNTGELKAGTEEEVKIVTRLHTATHLLQAALRVVLGPDVEQRGSDITAERTRFDFSYPRKLTHLERQSVQDWVNDKIKRDLPMQKEEMAYEEAIKSGALHFFKEKYPERVVVYTIKDPANPSGPPFSRELCGGPHVSRTGEIGH
ncbi:MAG: alanine--tRNA ligase-related protein, partial [Patescibacteria group bacterium]